MAITMSDRDVGIMAHFTYEVKEKFRAEAARRKMSMSALLAEIVEEWLEYAPQEQIEVVRSNKRKSVVEGPIDPLKDVPLPLDDRS